MQLESKTLNQGKASFVSKGNFLMKAGKKQLNKTDSLFADQLDEDGQMTSQKLTLLQTDAVDLASCFVEDSPTLLRSEQVFFNSLRIAKRNGNLTRDETRQMRVQA